MSKYDELRMAVSNLVISEDLYWGKLYDVYHSFQGELRAFLGLKDETVIDGHGNQEPVLTTGLYDQNSKKIISHAGSALPREDRKLCFQFLLNLCSSETEDIRIAKLINVKVRRNGDEYFFESDGLPSEVKCYEIDGRVNMSPFFDEVHSTLIARLNVRK
ncbi:TPA: hypothetical protein ACW0SX_001691 [Enterobacter soli]|uniref:hypothetical protein n=2 Tax=Enterobacteriaceae TaxID=543 RepID=UPI003D16E723